MTGPAPNRSGGRPHDRNMNATKNAPEGASSASFFAEAAGVAAGNPEPQTGKRTAPRAARPGAPERKAAWLLPRLDPEAQSNSSASPKGAEGRIADLQPFALDFFSFSFSFSLRFLSACLIKASKSSFFLRFRFNLLVM